MQQKVRTILVLPPEDVLVIDDVDEDALEPGLGDAAIVIPHV